MAKVEIVESDVIELSFRFRIYDIEEEFYGAQIWWKAGPIPEPTIDGWSSEKMLTFDGDEVIPDGVTECVSDKIYGYDWIENSDVTPDYGTSHFKVGLVFHFFFNYIKENGKFGIFSSYAGVVHKDSSSYGASLPLAIKQAYPGSTEAVFECDFTGLFEGDTDSLEYSAVTIFYADGSVAVPTFYYKDIGKTFTVLERTGDKVKWIMVVGDTFNISIGFYIQTETRVRPNIEEGWDSMYATHSASFSDKVYVVLVDEDAPECTITVTHEDIDYAYDGSRVTGVIKNCPIIFAADWNQFCSDINAVRAKAREKGVALPELSFQTVEAGKTEMSAQLFQDVFEAVCDTCPSTVEVPVSNVGFDKGADISGEALYILLGRLSVALQQSRDCYWSFSDNT